MNKPDIPEPDTFFNGSTFIPEKLAKHIMKENKYLTTRDNETIFHYKDGIYKPDGEVDIKETSKGLLKEKTKINYLNETVAYIKYSTMINRKEFNSFPELITMKNGCYDIKEKKFIPHSEDYMQTSMIPVIYDKNAEYPKINQLI